MTRFTALWNALKLGTTSKTGTALTLSPIARSYRTMSQRRIPSMLLICVAAVGFLGYNRAPVYSVALQQDTVTHTAHLRADVQNLFALVEARAQKLRRAQTITSFARHYRISRSLANDIYSAAEVARVDPDLAFRLVRLESDFDESATSPVGAIGLTQVMLATAQEWYSSLTAEQLYDRRLNLRIGLRYLRAMLDQHDGDVMHALAAYNRGPGTVRNLLAQGQLTSSAYERVIMRGYNGRGILE
jgi:soluble lytic murein transglycosylase-like protein